MSHYSHSSFNENNSNSSWHKVMRLIPEGARVLDVGCSSGNFGKILHERKKCVVDGIEVDEADAQLAMRQLNNIWVLDIEREDLSLVAGGYDIIYFGDVLEHLVDPVAVLRRVKRLLKKGGAVVFSIPNMAHAEVRLQLLKGDFDHTETGLLDKTHLHFYSLGEIQRVFMDAGYEIKKIDFIKKDLPNEVVEVYLNKIGLSGSDAFYRLMHSVEAAAFQFVGLAKPAARVRPVKRLEFGPVDLFEKHYQGIKKSMEKLSARIAWLDAELARKEEELRLLRQRPLRSIFKYLLKRLKDKIGL